MTVEKPKPGKQLLPPITTGAGSVMNQSQFLAIICNSLKAQKESRIHGAIGFGLASHWLKNWRESFKGELRCKNGLFSKKRAVREGSILTICLVFWSFFSYIVCLKRSRKSNLDFHHLGQFLSRVVLTSSCL